MKKRIISIITVLAVFALVFAGCSADGGESDVSTTEDVGAAFSAADPAELAEGLIITEVFPYTGAYLEDGSDEPCADVCAVRLANNSETHYQYVTFSVDTTGGSYSFSASTLFAGATMTVLCEGKALFTDDKIVSSELITCAPFTEPPSVHTDTLLITYTDGFVNVKNLTDAPLTGVYVYYKNTDEYGFLGGITYRAAVGDIDAGQLSQTRAAHIKKDTGKVVFATYKQ